MSNHEWRWKGPLGATHAEAFAEEIYLVLEAAHDPNMNGQWSTGSYSGDHSDRIECDLLPRLLDFMRMLVMAAKPSPESVPHDVARELTTDQQYWLDRRAQIIEALADEGLEILSDKDRVWLRNTGTLVRRVSRAPIVEG